MQNLVTKNIAGMQILVVDDSKMSRALLRNLLSENGYKHINHASSAMEALDWLEHNHADIILLDIIMREMNGIELCKKIKQSEETRDTPVIMITGSNRDETFIEAFKAGAMDYIGKPIDNMELQARVASALRLKSEIDLRKKREKELIIITSQDGLTGIANRRIFDETLSKEWNRAKRYKSPIGLALIDIDHFKLYNDHAGHLMGDDALKQVAKTLADVPKRLTDMVARYGGEEFVAILPETNRSTALNIAKKMNSAIRDLEIPHPAKESGGKVTISVGAASLIPGNKNSKEDLIAMADKALYRAKNDGRDRVALAEI